jgi:hypothetical protein
MSLKIRQNFALVFATMLKMRQICFALLVVLAAPSFAEEEDVGLIFTTQGKAFEEVAQGIMGDLEEDLSFVTVTLDKKSTVSDVSGAIKKHNPKVIVLVENNSLRLYEKYQKENPKASFPPSVAVAALFVDRYLSKLKNATGIRYEIPAVTSIVNMRSVITKKVRKVGVVHREWMKSTIEQNAKYCKAEGIELVSISLPNKGKKLESQLKSGLKKLSKDVDAIWVLNDNVLLNGKMIRSAWLPTIGKAKLPVIVGIKQILSTKLNFGSFAIVPDHYNLGVQAASIIGELMDDDWEIGDRDIEQPVSVKKVVNVAVLKKKSVKYNEDKLSAMDEVVR